MGRVFGIESAAWEEVWLWVDVECKQEEGCWPMCSEKQSEAPQRNKGLEGEWRSKKQ